MLYQLSYVRRLEAGEGLVHVPVLLALDQGDLDGVIDEDPVPDRLDQVRVDVGCDELLRVGDQHRGPAPGLANMEPVHDQRNGAWASWMERLTGFEPVLRTRGVVEHFV